MPRAAGPVLTLAREPPESADARALLAAGDAFASALYPPASNHMASAASLAGPGVSFLVARLDGRAVATGAVFRRGPDWSELKRMYVAPAARGQGVGRRLLQALEDIAGAAAPIVRLETGIRNAAALALYRSAGYVEIGPFGEYGPDPESVFLEKRLRTARS